MVQTRQTSMNFSLKAKDQPKRLITKNKFKKLIEADKFLGTEINALQTSCGLNFLERSKIIIDIDENKSLSEHIKNFKEKITDILGIKFSSYSYNKENGHIQFAIYLENEEKFQLGIERTQDHTNYLEITRKLNSLINGDLKFTGWHCRNHFYSSKKYVAKVNEYRVSKKELENKILSSNICFSSSFFNSDFLSDFSCNSNIEVNKKLGKQHYEVLECHNFWKSKNYKCSEIEMINNLLEKENEIAKKTSSKPHSTTEVINRARSCWKWLKNNFDISKSSKYNKFNSSKRSHNKNVRILQTKELRKNLSASKTAAKLNVSVRTIMNYTKQIKEKLEETIQKIQQTASKNIILNFENLCWLIQPSISVHDKFYELEHQLT